MLKYVRTKNDEIVIFPFSVKHSHIASGLKSKIISAAFFAITKDGIFVTGRSESLNLESLPDDAELIDETLTTDGGM